VIDDVVQARPLGDTQDLPAKMVLRIMVLITVNLRVPDVGIIRIPFAVPSQTFSTDTIRS
jgi:hypothetical protein